jgi:hypothetical protein
MAHFALVTEQKVQQVIVIANDDCDNLPFPESEPVGQAFIASMGIEGTWKQTSYNAKFRARYAGIGYKYDATNDEFIAPEVEAV